MNLYAERVKGFVRDNPTHQWQKFLQQTELFCFCPDIRSTCQRSRQFFNVLQIGPRIA